MSIRRTQLLALLLALAAGAPLAGQSWKDRLKQKVHDKVDQKASAPDSATAQPGAAESTGGGAADPEAPAFVNYDFVPGDRVLFAEDFSNDRVGDLPGRVKVVSGNFEVADYLGGRWLRTTSGGNLQIVLPAPLPQRYTFEATLVHTWGWDVAVHFDGESGDEGKRVVFGSSPGISPWTSGAGEDRDMKPYHARVMVDGNKAKVYLDGKRVTNAADVTIGHSNIIEISVPGDDNTPGYITDIRVAEGSKPLFQALSASGRVATHGILFDVGSDHIRPESKPTLDEIGGMLGEHPDLRLTIEGHTDNSGGDAANLALSQRRAESVRQYLVDHYHVDAARLQAKGFGSTRPAAPNTTAEGRQINRRVELVRS